MSERENINLDFMNVLQICEIIGFLEAVKQPSAKQYAQFLREIIGKTAWG